MATDNEWFALAEKLFEKAKTIFAGAHILESAEGTADPKVVALTLLGRTASNFEAAILLLENNHVVEARTITRCCYENLFWIASLVRKGKEFVAAMELDDAANRMRRAKHLLKWAREQPHKVDFSESLEAFYETLKTDKDTTKSIKQKQAAEDGGIGLAYISYTELSTDAAHPSATSLSRHVKWQEGGEPHFSVYAEPVPEPRETEDTLELLCSAMLGVCVGANEAVGGTEGGERLDVLAAEFRVLSNKNKTAREAN